MDAELLFNEAMSQLLQSGKGYGLDFGTYRSMMACKDMNESSAVIASYEDPELRKGVPSLFWYSAAEAKEYSCDQVVNRNGQLDDPIGVCSSVKMHLTEESIFLNGKSFTPEYIATSILRRVVSLSHDAFQKDLFAEPVYDRLVVGVPVRFGAAQRRKLLTVIQNATGLRNIVLLPEPIAAALAYEKKSNGSNKKVLVLDIGAGTFDTVLLIPNEKRTHENPFSYTPMYPDGLNIAGNTFDNRMKDILIKKLSETGELDIAKLSNPNTVDYRRLLVTAREAKERLSNTDSCSVMVEGTAPNGNPSFQRITVTREEFENAILPDVTSLIDCAYGVLEKAGMQYERNIDILLVGGSSYIPLVRRKLIEKCRHISENRILQRIPEQAIALGCAYYANDEINCCQTAVAYAYAIRCYNAERNVKFLDIVIPSNVKLPYSVRKTYRTSRADTDSCDFHFYEVEYGEQNQKLELSSGKITDFCVTHQFGKKVPENTLLDAEYVLSKNGILTITIDDRNISPKHTEEIDFSHLKIGVN